MVDLSNISTITIGGKDVANIQINNKLVWEKQTMTLELSQDGATITATVKDNGQPVSGQAVTIYTSSDFAPTIAINNGYATIIMETPNSTKVIVFSNANTLSIRTFNTQLLQYTELVNGYSLSPVMMNRLEINPPKIIIQYRVGNNYQSTHEYDIGNADVLYFTIEESSIIAANINTTVNVFLVHGTTNSNGQYSFTSNKQDTKVTGIIDGTNISKTITI